MSPEEAVARRLRAEIENELERLARLRRDAAGAPSTDDPYAIRARGSILHDLYNGIERIFERIADELDGGLPRESYVSTRSNSAALTLLAAFLTACGGGPAPTFPAPTPAPAQQPTSEPAPEPPTCDQVRKLALDFRPDSYCNDHVHLVEEWDGTPFPFYIDSPDHEHEKEIRDVAEELSDYIEDRIGHSIFEVKDRTLERQLEFDLDNFNACHVAGKPGEIVAFARSGFPEGKGTGGANTRSNVIFWDPDKVTVDGIVPHELFNLFGFRDHGDDEKGPYGVEMFL